ncbi:MAG TPA: glycosyltransferase [Bacteroidia bacterium]|jgi:uncharacterized protein (TIGR00661 family)
MRRLKILVSPLDWGLGHATRCIPIIKTLSENGCEVLIGADGRALELLKHEFPSQQFLRMPGYNIRYPAKGSMAIKMAASFPRILKGIRSEHEQLHSIIKEHSIDAVISDNRFGLWNKKIPSVFITHQLMIKSPLGENALHHFNKRYINRFSSCWIPDNNGENNLSGDLSHKYPLPAHAEFIGLLSRFNPATYVKEDLNILVLLSGPEPQRTLLEKKLLQELIRSGDTALVVRGVTEKQERKKLTSRVSIVNYMTADELEKELYAASIVIARPGYSTVMDLATLKKKKVIFIPTPGQTEQEYLAERLSNLKIAYYSPQENLNLESALGFVKEYNGFSEEYDNVKYAEVVKKWIEEIR